MSNRQKRQPKAGEIAYAKALPFTRVERGPASEAIATDYTKAMKGVRITYCKPAKAYGSDTWRKTGGMTGGATGSTRGTTSNNGSGVVPQAFVNHVAR